MAGAVLAVDQPTVADWVARARPFVATRGMPAQDADVVSLGLPLPPARGKRRIALQARVSEIRARRAPFELGDCLGSAPPEWLSCLSALDQAGRAAGIRFQVYGSLAMQHATGEHYLTPRSDLDLLWQASDRNRLDHGIATLQRWQARNDLRVDGEVLLPGNLAVAWREWAARPPRVLVKGESAVALWPLERCFKLFQQVPA